MRRPLPSAACAALLTAALAATPACKRKQAAPAQRPAADAQEAAPIEVSELAFAGPEGLRAGRNFSRGERPICLMTLRGFTYKDRRVDITVDVTVTDPDGQTVLAERELRLIYGEAPTLTPGMIRAATTLTLPPSATPGRYQVALRVHDKLGGGRGAARASFTLLGSPPDPAARLLLRHVRVAGDDTLPPGAVVPVVLEAAGYDTRKQDDRFVIDLSVTTELLDPTGKVLRRSARGKAGATLLFEPRAFPMEVYFEIPRATPPGSYRVRVTVRDRTSGDQAQATVPVTVTPRRFGIFNVHLHDAGGLPRRGFRLGEQAYLRLSVHGFRTRGGEADVAVDIGVAGPDGGVYLARKGAAVARGEASRAAVAAGRFPVQIPLLIPAIAPVGAYKIVVRARDRLAGADTAREWLFDVAGNPPPPVATFRVTDLVVRERADLPPTRGDTFIEGRSYQLTLLVGGVRPPAGEQKLIFPVDVRAGLRLRRVADGKVVARAAHLFRVARKLSHRPLRLPLTATWKVPAGLPAGLYDLVVEAVDQLSDRASQLSRRVEVVSSGRIVPVTLPESAGMPAGSTKAPPGTGAAAR